MSDMSNPAVLAAPAGLGSGSCVVADQSERNTARPRQNQDVSDPQSLAEEIHRKHERAEHSLCESVRHAVQAGELLLQAKKAVGHGGPLGAALDYLATKAASSSAPVD